MNKLEMAHDFAMKLVGNPTTPLKDMNSIIGASWKYADAMQAEADKRDKAGAEEKRKYMRELLNADNTFVEKEGQHFDDVEWQPDWSQAPDTAIAWEMRYGSNTEARWCHDKDKAGFSYTVAPTFNYQGNWQASLRKRPE